MEPGTYARKRNRRPVAKASTVLGPSTTSQKRASPARLAALPSGTMTQSKPTLGRQVVCDRKQATGCRGSRAQTFREQAHHPRCQPRSRLCPFNTVLRVCERPDECVRPMRLGAHPHAQVSCKCSQWLLQTARVPRGQQGARTVMGHQALQCLQTTAARANLQKRKRARTDQAR